MDFKDYTDTSYIKETEYIPIKYFSPLPGSSTAFLEAAERGDSHTVKQVLDSTNINPDIRSKIDSRSALHIACGYGQTTVVRELLTVSFFSNTI